MKYIEWQKKNRGYEFIGTSDGVTVLKIGLWYKYKDFESEIEKLCNNEHCQYERKQKKYFENGVYNGPIEGAFPARQYENCMQDKPIIKKIYHKRDK